MRRIVFLNTTSVKSPYTGGRCIPIARALAKRGYEVHIVTLHHAFTRRTSRSYPGGITVHHVGQMHVYKSAHTTQYFSLARLIRVVLWGTWAIFKTGLALEGDIYHIGKPHPQNSISGLLIRGIAKRSSRLFLDYDDIESASNVTRSPWQRWGLHAFETYVPRYVDGITYHSTYLGSRLSQRGIPAHQCFRLPSIVESRRFQCVQEGTVKRWRRRLGLLPTESVVMYVGTISLANHPVDMLIDAFVLLRSKGVRARLVVAGGGPDLEWLRHYAVERGVIEQTTFVGRVPFSDVPALLQLATVTVDPVHDDVVARARWPLKIAESLVAGVPVVTGDVGDRHEMLGRGAAGILVSPGDERALADGIASVLNDPGRLAQLRKGAKEVGERFLSDEVIDHLIGFYRGEL